MFMFSFIALESDLPSWPSISTFSRRVSHSLLEVSRYLGIIILFISLMWYILYIGASEFLWWFFGGLGYHSLMYLTCTDLSRTELFKYLRSMLSNNDQLRYETASRISAIWVK